jgi:hypothetical protein
MRKALGAKRSMATMPFLPRAGRERSLLRIMLLAIRHIYFLHPLGNGESGLKFFIFIGIYPDRGCGVTVEGFILITLTHMELNMTEKIFRAKHVRDAAKLWDKNPGYRGFRNSTTYDVLIGGKAYPPKAIASYAHELADNPKLLEWRKFGGALKGKWLKRLKEAGFEIRPKVGRGPMDSAGLDEKAEFVEGAKKYRRHIQSERNSKVVKLAKKRRWQEKGAYACDICQFDFARIYGELGAGYIEAHHTIPVSQMLNGHKTKVSDLALVCSNCHRMLHTMKPLITIKELKAIRDKAAKKNGTSGR